MAAANCDMTVLIEPLQPDTNIILIKKVIDDTHDAHEHLYESTTYFRGCIVADIWMIISHMYTRTFPRDGSHNTQDNNVDSLNYCEH